MTVPDPCCARAREILGGGDAHAAFRELRPALAYPAAPEGAALRDALGVFHDVAAALAGDKLASAIAWARDRDDDPEALYDAAFALYEEKLHDIAAMLLARADRLSPGSPTLLTELSANLEAMLLHAQAARVLLGSGLVESDPMCAYLYGFNALLSGDLAAARPIAERLRAHADESVAYMAEALFGMLARADAIAADTPLDARDLAGWHLVINGSLLLHLSPHGYDEPMCGRYAYVSDSYALIREGLDRLAAALTAAGLAPPRVFALPDRSSRVVALAAAQLLGLPCEAWPGDGDTRPGLVVAYDLDKMSSGDVLVQLRDHRPGQILFAHASCWTDPFPFAPDVTTFLYQSSAAPWDGGQLTLDGPSAPDASKVEELAARIVSAAGEHESVSTLEQLTALARAARRVPAESAAGILRESGPRLRQRAGSPVASARFS